METKRKVIILEGVDKTGKSTIAEKLLKANPGAILIKQNRRDLKDIKQAYIDMCLVLRSMPGNATIILDRFYPSQMVYSILRGEDDMNSIFYYTLENDMLEHTTLEFEILYCTASEETIARRFEEDREEYVKSEEIGMLKKRYEEFIKKTKLKVYIYDTTQ